MKLQKSVLLSLLVSSVACAPAKVRRDDKPFADFFAKILGETLDGDENGQTTLVQTTTQPAPQTTSAQAVQTTTPAPAAGGSKGVMSFLDSILGFFDRPGSGDNQSDTKTSPTTFSTSTPSTTTPSTSTPSTTTPSTSTTSTSPDGLDIGVSASFGFSFGSNPTSNPDSDSDSDSDEEIDAERSGGISYSPYTTDGQCKSRDQVGHDMQVLSKFKIIRLYGVDCHGVDNTIATINSDQKLFIGIYNIDDYNINQDLTIMKKAVESSSRGWDAVDTVSIGNELVNFGKASGSDITNAIKTAKLWFKQNAPLYKGSIVSVDTLVAVLGNPELCSASDYLAVNCHPFWDGGVDPSDSGSWLQKQISQLKSTCNNNKRILITESGWPTEGKSFGNCVPSKENQVKAIKSIVDSLGEDVFVFTTYNDYWKDGGDYGVEKYWGIFGDPKA